MKRTVLAPALVLAGAVFTGGWFLQEGVRQEQNIYLQSRLLQEVADRIRNDYVEEVDASQLYESAIRGMVDDLDDPNSSYIKAADWEDLRIRTEGDYGEVGLEITQREGFIVVVTPMPGGPATRAGIRAGDRIVEIDGASTGDWSSDQAANELRGRPGTEVRLTIDRPGVDEPVPFTITRDRIQVRALPFAEVLEGDVGYLPLQGFNETASRELGDELEALRSRGIRGLILDLRGNPGGILDEGVAVSDLFLPRGVGVVETRGRAVGQTEAYSTRDGDRVGDLPMVVLVDERSASASEIVAGALQDHDRAVVIGAPSFGKGSVQSLYPLSGGSVLRLTTARWYTPSGRSIQVERDDQLALLEEGVPTVAGYLVRRPDTAEARPTFTSDAGRPLLGGGGIVPDLSVLPDTLTTDEQQAVREIQTQAGAVGVALFDFAVRYLNTHPGLEVPFTLETSIIGDFLASREIEVDRETLRRAERYLRYQIAREVALQAEGERGAFLQTRDRDRQLQRALELLGGADDRSSLFRAAGSPLEPGPSAGDPDDGEPEDGDEP